MFLVCQGLYDHRKHFYVHVIGYYATTTEVTFVAITKPPSQTQPASIQYLFSHNLHLRNQRVTNLVHLIRLSGVVAKLGEMLNRRFMPEYKDIMRYAPLLVCL